MRKLEIQEKNQIRKLIKSYFLVSYNPLTHSLRLASYSLCRDLPTAKKTCNRSSMIQI